MNQALRFWLVLVPLILGVTATGYLSLTFLQPTVVVSGRNMRLLVTLLALTGYGLFAGSTAVFGRTGSSSGHKERKD
jgi:hypothetical protein